MLWNWNRWSTNTLVKWWWWRKWRTAQRKPSWPFSRRLGIKKNAYHEHFIVRCYCISCHSLTITLTVIKSIHYSVTYFDDCCEYAKFMLMPLHSLGSTIEESEPSQHPSLHWYSCERGQEPSTHHRVCWWRNTQKDHQKCGKLGLQYKCTDHGPTVSRTCEFNDLFLANDPYNDLYRISLNSSSLACIAGYAVYLYSCSKSLSRGLLGSLLQGICPQEWWVVVTLW